MASLSGNTSIKLTATLLVALALFTFTLNVASAQTGMEESPERPSAKVESGKVVKFDTAGQLVYDGLTSIGGLVLALGGRLLDTSLSWFVFDMKGTIDTLNLTQVISDVWKLVRDLFNLLFIFGLMFIGFKIILDIDDASSKRTLGTLVVAALLINFSLYVTQVIIDFSNIASAEIGEQLKASASSRASVFGMEITNISSGFIAATDLENLRTTTLSKVNELTTGKVISLPETSLGVGHALAIGLTIASMMILIGFVFVAGALIMFTRFMYLIFLMMFSPVMFLGWVLPSFKQRSADWWRTLFNQAFVGPAYLFTLVIALWALDSLIKSRATTGDTSITAFLITSLLVSAFAWGALMVAQKMGAAGASTAMSYGQRWGKSIRGSVTGFAGRRTLGRAGDWYNRRLEERGVSEKSGSRRFASSLAGAKFGGSFSRADERASSEKAAQKRARYDQKKTVLKNMDDYMASPQGTQERINMERSISESTNEQIIEILGSTEKGSPQYKHIVENMTAGQFDAAMKAKPEELDDKAKLELKTARTIATQDVLRKAAVDKAHEKDKNSTLDRKDPEALQSGIKDAKDYQLKILGVQTLSENAAYLKQSQFDEIMKSKDYTPAEQEQIRKARNKGLQEMFDDDDKRVSMFKGMQDKDIASLPKEILLDENGRSVQFIGGGALKKIAEDDKLAESDREALRDNIRVREGIDAKSSAIKYLKSPQGQEKYGGWPE